ncbi:hypothetical protein F5X99DRAFT_381098 [Biscogniauxia marginata]|nr:hypothetical protein F5X99DRAFT_381098 [Biscogniauxia marginata]
MALTTRISLVARSVIQDAFKDLEQTISVGDRAYLNNTTLDDVRQAAHNIEDVLAARQSLRNMRRLMPLFTGLEYYSKSIEVLCNGTPFLPWIWAPIKLILKVASGYVEAFEKIIGAYARIAEPLARFKVLDRAYSRNPDVQQPLAIFYADILKFHKQAYKFVRRSGWKVFFLTSWGRFQRRFDSIIEDLKVHEDLVDKTANAVNISEAHKMRENLEVWRQETLDKLDRDEKEQTAAQYLAVVSWLKLDEYDQLNIFDSIAFEASSNAGTCDWILKQPKISAWMRCSQEASFLVLHGHPGTGKSVLATQIATFLKSDGRSLIVTHFCTYSYAVSKDYANILRSILVQLIRSNTDLVAHVYEELILKKKAPSSQLLEQLLRDLVSAASLVPSQTGYVHLIVDGLDECDSDTQAKTIRMLERIVSTALLSGSTVCKVLLSSRISQVITKKSRHKQTISLSDEKDNMEKAIRHYAAQRLGALRPRLFQMGISDDNIKTIGFRIATKADGMFLWARLVLEYLATNMLFHRDEIMRAADVLPRKLSEFYGQILMQLTSHFDDRSVARMRSILGWIAFAKRPLRKVEFRSALAFSTGDQKASELPPQYVFGMCIPLVEERRDSTFAFIHVSVRDFLQSSESNVILNEETALSEQGLATVTCLLSGFRVFSRSFSKQSRFLRVVRSLHAFHTYATEYWLEYLLSNASSVKGMDMNSKLFLLSCELSKALKELTMAPGSGKDDHASLLLDNRLAYLQHGSELYEVARTLLFKRRSRYLEMPDPDNGTTTDLVEVTSLDSLLFNYQHTIKELLSMRSCSGVSLQEFERFKQEFRMAAFTCRLWSCPRAAMGFDNDNLRLAHEASHRRILCDVPDCQYPPFPSHRSLKEHHTKCHSEKGPGLKRTTIKKFSASIPSSTPKDSKGDLNMMAKQGMPMQTGQMHPRAMRPRQLPQLPLSSNRPWAKEAGGLSNAPGDEASEHGEVPSFLDLEGNIPTHNDAQSETFGLASPTMRTARLPRSATDFQLFDATQEVVSGKVLDDTDFLPLLVEKPTEKGPSEAELGAFYNAGKMGSLAGITPRSDAAQGDGKIHALSDHQMKIMLLQQQNKRRLMMARQEQDIMTGIRGDSAGPIGPGGPAEPPGPNGEAFIPHQWARTGTSNPAEQVKRDAPQMNTIDTLPPLPQRAHTMSFTPSSVDPNMQDQLFKGMNNVDNNRLVQMNEGMRPPSSHPNQPFNSQMNPQMMGQQQSPQGSPQQMQWQQGPVDPV